MKFRSFLVSFKLRSILIPLISIKANIIIYFINAVFTSLYLSLGTGNSALIIKRLCVAGIVKFAVERFSDEFKVLHSIVEYIKTHQSGNRLLDARLACDGSYFLAAEEEVL